MNPLELAQEGTAVTEVNALQQAEQKANQVLNINPQQVTTTPTLEPPELIPATTPEQPVDSNLIAPTVPQTVQAPALDSLTEQPLATQTVPALDQVAEFGQPELYAGDPYEPVELPEFDDVTQSRVSLGSEFYNGRISSGTPTQANQAKVPQPLRDNWWNYLFNPLPIDSREGYIPLGANFYVRNNGLVGSAWDFITTPIRAGYGLIADTQRGYYWLRHQTASSPLARLYASNERWMRFVPGLPGLYELFGDAEGTNLAYQRFNQPNTFTERREGFSGRFVSIFPNLTAGVAGAQMAAFDTEQQTREGSDVAFEIDPRESEFTNPNAGLIFGWHNPFTGEKWFDYNRYAEKGEQGYEWIQNLPRFLGGGGGRPRIGEEGLERPWLELPYSLASVFTGTAGLVISDVANPVNLIFDIPLDRVFNYVGKSKFWKARVQPWLDADVTRRGLRRQPIVAADAPVSTAREEQLARIEDLYRQLEEAGAGDLARAEIEATASELAGVPRTYSPNEAADVVRMQLIGAGYTREEADFAASELNRAFNKQPVQTARRTSFVERIQTLATEASDELKAEAVADIIYDRELHRLITGKEPDMSVDIATIEAQKLTENDLLVYDSDTGKLKLAPDRDLLISIVDRLNFRPGLYWDDDAQAFRVNPMKVPVAKLNELEGAELLYDADTQTLTTPLAVAYTEDDLLDIVDSFLSKLTPEELEANRTAAIALLPEETLDVMIADGVEDLADILLQDELGLEELNKIVDVAKSNPEWADNIRLIAQDVVTELEIIQRRDAMLERMPTAVEKLRAEREARRADVRARLAQRAEDRAYQTWLETNSKYSVWDESQAYEAWLESRAYETWLETYSKSDDSPEYWLARQLQQEAQLAARQSQVQEVLTRIAQTRFTEPTPVVPPANVIDNLINGTPAVTTSNAVGEAIPRPVVTNAEDRARALWNAGARLPDIIEQTGLSRQQLSRLSRQWHSTSAVPTEQGLESLYSLDAFTERLANQRFLQFSDTALPNYNDRDVVALYIHAYNMRKADPLVAGNAKWSEQFGAIVAEMDNRGIKTYETTPTPIPASSTQDYTTEVLPSQAAEPTQAAPAQLTKQEYTPPVRVEPPYQPSALPESVVNGVEYPGLEESLKVWKLENVQSLIQAANYAGIKLKLSRDSSGKLVVSNTHNELAALIALHENSYLPPAAYKNPGRASGVEHPWYRAYRERTVASAPADPYAPGVGNVRRQRAEEFNTPKLKPREPATTQPRPATVAEPVQPVRTEPTPATQPATQPVQLDSMDFEVIQVESAPTVEGMIPKTGTIGDTLSNAPTYEAPAVSDTTDDIAGMQSLLDIATEHELQPDEISRPVERIFTATTDDMHKAALADIASGKLDKYPETPEKLARWYKERESAEVVLRTENNLDKLKEVSDKLDNQVYVSEYEQKIRSDARRVGADEAGLSLDEVKENIRDEVEFILSELPDYKDIDLRSLLSKSQLGVKGYGRLKNKAQRFQVAQATLLDILDNLDLPASPLPADNPTAYKLQQYNEALSTGKGVPEATRQVTDQLIHENTEEMLDAVSVFRTARNDSYSEAASEFKQAKERVSRADKVMQEITGAFYASKEPKTPEEIAAHNKAFAAKEKEKATRYNSNVESQRAKLDKAADDRIAEILAKRAKVEEATTPMEVLEAIDEYEIVEVGAKAILDDVQEVPISQGIADELIAAEELEMLNINKAIISEAAYDFDSDIVALDELRQAVIHELDDAEFSQAIKSLAEDGKIELMTAGDTAEFTPTDLATAITVCDIPIKSVRFL